MKKILLLLVIILSITISYGEVLLGADLRYDFDFHDSRTKDSLSNRYSSRIDNRLQLTPRIGIMPSELLEISPFLIFNLNTSKREAPTYTSTTRMVDLGCGIGTFFHIIRREIIHLSFGPQLQFQYMLKPYGDVFPDYDEYIDVELSIGSPLNLDFHPNDKFAIRLLTSIVDFKYSRYLHKYEGQTYSNNDFEIDLRSIFSPSLGFFFTLK